ncbi:hypothetical protein NQ318_023181 [Aromia moschata]|uniref:Mos1 transposase HTH domain-containing protein n=1 Tax=Aromia moschata TaxID=1265417 RepID=A0AAV8Y0H1_9CUCU|nr:hypothetical protein NQ318_023181 [Aromia moschata]
MLSRFGTFGQPAGRVKISSGYLKTCAESQTAAIKTFFPVPQSAGSYNSNLKGTLRESARKSGSDRTGTIVRFKMSDINFEQRCAIRFCFRLGHSATDTFAKLQHAYEDSVFSKAQVFRWLY